MKRFLLTTLLILSAAVAGAAEKINLKTIPAEKFLEIARRAPAQETWARMDGIIQHRRSGAATITSTLRLRVRFTPARIIGQVILDDEEYYNLGQTFSNPPQSTRTLGGRASDRRGKDRLRRDRPLGRVHRRCIPSRGHQILP